MISIHALLAESDLRHLIPNSGTLHFYPRSPCGERRNVHRDSGASRQFLSTLSLRRATPPVRDIIQWEGIFLSTLSLRRATNSRADNVKRHEISIHALLAESDCLAHETYVIMEAFLSTLSLRRATRSRSGRILTSVFLSTLSLGRATSVTTAFQGGFAISIHALLAESDSDPVTDKAWVLISIHALLAESDPRGGYLLS